MHQDKKGHHRKSFFGPILLITIGLVFLGKNLGLIPGEGWSTIWRLWPLLLIIGGLDDLFRREGVAWPILVIGIGIALLYHYFGPRTWFSWMRILQLWPVIIIAIGIDVIFRGQTGWKNLLGIVLSILLIGAAVLLGLQGGEIQVDSLNIDQNYAPGVEAAEIEMSLSVGEFLLGPDSQGDKLISGLISPGSAQDDLDSWPGKLSYELKSTAPVFFPDTARWQLGLTPDLPLQLKVDNSVGEMLLDLAELRLVSLFANQGVGRMVVDLPDQIDEDVLLKQGIGVIEIEIPEDVRIAIDAKNGLSRVKFPEGFELEDGYYTTPGATRYNADLLIVVEQGIGLVTFQYFK